MLRRILITLGLLVTFLPYLGFPHAWQSVIMTITGLLIVFFLVLARPRKSVQEIPGTREEIPRSLHVERMNEVERPIMHVEHGTSVPPVIEDVQAEELPQKKVLSILRRKRKKPEAGNTEVVPHSD